MGLLPPSFLPLVKGQVASLLKRGVDLPHLVGMAELVDALGLGSSEVIRGGSSPLTDIGSRYADSIERRQLSGQVVLS